MKRLSLCTFRALKNNALCCLLCFCCLCVGTARGQWWTGYSAQTGLVLCLHLDDSVAQLYSPLQDDAPITVTQWSLQHDTLRLECGGIGFKTTLVRKADEWHGFWKQGILRENIVFHPADTLFQLRRPQTPQPPYSFEEETVTADYTDSQGNAIHLEGTLSYPKGKGPFPTVLLVSGSGQQNRDEELFQHRPFLVLADYLARRGIAVLRYDDRGVGKSTGPLDSCHTYLFAEDAEAMFRALGGNRHVDPSCLGIGGHSEGGAIASLVAARNKDVKFVVMLAGQGCSGREVLLQQNEALLRANGVGDGLVAVAMECIGDLFALPANATQKDYQEVINRHTTRAQLSKEQIDSIGLGRGKAYQVRQQMNNRWIQTFLTLDPANYLPQVKCPVLALNGSKDCQVLATPNLNRIKALCPHARCVELPGLNHLFQHASTGLPEEYIFIDETFSEDAMKQVADWILKLK